MSFTCFAVSRMPWQVRSFCWFLWFFFSFYFFLSLFLFFFTSSLPFTFPFSIYLDSWQQWDYILWRGDFSSFYFVFLFFFVTKRKIARIFVSLGNHRLCKDGAVLDIDGMHRIVVGSIYSLWRFLIIEFIERE